ncbi:MAG: hypothetical protein ACXVQY_03525 [Actinomycetota bacterium]
MNGATLRLLDALRAVSHPNGPHTRSSLEAFARLLLGDVIDDDDVRWIETLVVRVQPFGHGDRAEPFRLVFEAVADRGQRIDLTDARMRGQVLALEGLLFLPLRERAALATSCVLGFAREEVAQVIGTTPAHAGAIVDGAVALLRREAGLGGPVERRSKRRASPAA